jgi:hypothetical protein
MSRNPFQYAVSGCFGVGPKVVPDPMDLSTHA